MSHKLLWMLWFDKKVYLMSYLHTYKQGRRDFPTWENIFQLGWIVNQAIVPLNNTLKHVEISLRFKKMNKTKTLMILMLMEFSKYTTTHHSPTNKLRSLPFFTSTKKLVKPPFEKSKQKAGRLISRKRTGILFFHFINILFHLLHQLDHKENRLPVFCLQRKNSWNHCKKVDFTEKNYEDISLYHQLAKKNHCSLKRSRHSLLILVERGRHYVYLGGGELSLKDSKLLHSRYICLGSHAECNITSAQDAGAELRQSWVCTGAFKLSQLFKQADDAWWWRWTFTII